MASIVSTKLVSKRDKWNVVASSGAKSTVNPIRKIVETLDLEPNPEKQLIPLSIGDPTVFGNLVPCKEIIDAMIDSIQSNKNNGYFPASGSEEARKAVAEYCSFPGAEVDWKDVILASGCSHALDLCITVLAVPGSNILVPRPGFPLYQTLTGTLEVEIRYYNLLPDKNWEIDLNDLSAQLDCNTVAIIYNNPSNPCGSVFSKEHILDIINIAEKHYVPIIADEIYEDLVFPGNRFYPIASLTNQVPVLSCGGTTKKFLVPGWRLGWILIHDRQSRFGNEIRNGLNALAQRIIGPNSIIQGALPRILKDTPKSYFEDTINFIQSNALLAYKTLQRIAGLHPIMPSGAMYIMVKMNLQFFPEFKSDLNLVEKLVSEESVFCLPGQCFNYPGYIRIVLTVPTVLFEDALNRMEQFFKRHYVSVNGLNN